MDIELALEHADESLEGGYDNKALHKLAAEVRMLRERIAVKERAAFLLAQVGACVRSGAGDAQLANYVRGLIARANEETSARPMVDLVDNV